MNAQVISVTSFKKVASAKLQRSSSATVFSAAGKAAVATPPRPKWAKQNAEPCMAVPNLKRANTREAILAARTAASAESETRPAEPSVSFKAASEAMAAEANDSKRELPEVMTQRPTVATGAGMRRVSSAKGLEGAWRLKKLSFGRRHRPAGNAAVAVRDLRRGSESAAPSTLEVERLKARTEIKAEINKNRRYSEADAMARAAEKAAFWHKATEEAELEERTKRVYKPTLYARFASHLEQIAGEGQVLLGM